MRALQYLILSLAVLFRSCMAGDGVYNREPRPMEADEILVAARQAEQEHNALRALFLAGRLAGYSSFVDVTDEEYPPMLDANATEYQEAREILARNQSELLWVSPTYARQDWQGLDYKVVWSPVGNYIAAYYPIYYAVGHEEVRALEEGLGKTVPIYDVDRGDIIERIEVDISFVIMRAAWSPDGTRIALAGRDRGNEKIIICDVWGDAEPIEFANDARCIWSPDSSSIVTWNRREVRLWDASTGELIKVVATCEDGKSFDSVSMSPDGSQIVVMYDRFEGQRDPDIWDLETGEKLYTFDGDMRVRWSPDGSRIISWGNWGLREELVVRDARTWEVVQTFSEFFSVSSASWSPDGERIAIMEIGEIHLFDVVSGEKILTTKLLLENDRYLQWSPSGDNFVTNTEYGSVRVWNAHSGELLYESENRGMDSSLPVWNADGTKLAYLEGGRVVILTVDNGQLTNMDNGHMGTIRDAYWNTGQNHIISVGNDVSVCCWNIDNGTLLNSFVSGALWVSPNSRGSLIAYSDKNSIISLYDTNAGTVIKEFDCPKGGLGMAAWSPDESRIAVVSGAGYVFVWDIQTGTMTHELNDHIGSSPSERAFWNPNGHILASDYGFRLFLWDLRTNERTAELPDDQFISFNDDGTMLLTRCHNTYCVRDGIDGSLLMEFDGHMHTWIPGGPYFAVADHDGLISIYDVSNKNIVNTIPTSYGLRWMDASPDGTMLAGRVESTICIYDIASSDLLFALECPGCIHGVAWSEDGTRILAYGPRLYVWDLAGNPQGRFSRDIMRFASFDGREGLTFGAPLGDIGEVLAITRQ